MSNNMMNSNINKSNKRSNLSLGNRNEIKLKFVFINIASFLVRCKENEKLSEIINRFKHTQCPRKLKPYLPFPIYEGNIIDKEKTLSQLGIKNKVMILFSSENAVEDYANKKNEQNDLDEDEKMQLNKWITEFKLLDSLNKIGKIINIPNVNNSMINNQLNNYKEVFEKGDTMANFKEFIIKKENHGAIIAKEHQISFLIINI